MHPFFWLIILTSTAFAQQATPIIVAEVRSQPLSEDLGLVGITQPRRLRSLPVKAKVLCIAAL